MLHNLAFIFLIALAACNVYHSDFDCAPGKGVPCASVTEIESMIVETKEGPDIFPFGCQPPNYYWTQELVCESNNYPRKVWIPDTEDASGCRVGGHYIYLPIGDE